MTIWYNFLQLLFELVYQFYTSVFQYSPAEWHKKQSIYIYIYIPLYNYAPMYVRMYLTLTAGEAKVIDKHYLHKFP